MADMTFRMPDDHCHIAEWNNKVLVNQIYQGIIQQTQSGADVSDPDQVERVAKFIMASLLDNSVRATPDQERDAQALVNAINKSALASDEQKEHIKNCFQISGDESTQKQYLRTCMDELLSYQKYVANSK